MPSKSEKNAPSDAPRPQRMRKSGKILLGLGVGVLTAGYMLLATGSITLAPLLIVGGLILVGAGIALL